MQKTNLSNPSERKKVIVAAVLGMVAIVVLWWAFFGFGSGSTAQPTQRNAAVTPPGPGLRTATNNTTKPQTPADVTSDVLAQLEPVSFQQSPISAPEPKRNIFAYYEAPPPTTQSAQTPTPTPEPTPPVMLATVAPSNVYARTADFTLE